MFNQPRSRGPDEIFCFNCGLVIRRDSRFCPYCGIAQAAGTVASPGGTIGIAEGFPQFPLRYDVPYPAKLSRLLIFVKWLLVIPHYLIIYALGVVALAVSFFAFFAILFTKRYPRGLFNLVVNINRWGANASAYWLLLRDEYPPFSWEPNRYPVIYDVEYPEKLNRWLPLVKWILVVPNQLVLALLTFVSFFVYIIGWFAILFTGRFPKGLFSFIVSVQRWQFRSTAYTALLRDEYPPYSGDHDAKPGGRTSIVLGALIGLPYQAAIISFFIFFTPGLSPVSPKTIEVPVSYESVLHGTSSPTVEVSGVDVTLLNAQDPAQAAFDLAPAPAGKRYVAFHMEIHNRDSLFALIDQKAFRLKDSSGRNHAPTLVVTSRRTNSNVLAKGNLINLSVIFEIDNDARPSELTYSPNFAAFLPFGERVRFLFR